jgi:hypothetical protein
MRYRPETRDVFGFCGNLVPIILQCDAERSFEEFLLRVRNRSQVIQGLSDFPYDELQRELQHWKIKPPRSLAILSLASTTAPLFAEDLEVTELTDFTPVIMPPGIDLKFDRNNEEHGCTLMFDAGRYDPVAMRAIVDRLARLFRNASRHPERPLREIFSMS